MRILGDILRLYLRKSHRDWVRLLNDIEIKINYTEHRITGVPPVSLMYRILPGPGELTCNSVVLGEKEYQELCQAAISKSNRSIISRGNAFVATHASPTKLHAGQEVYVRNHVLSNKVEGFAKKLAPLFKGPYRVTSEVGHNTYEIKNLDTHAVETHHITNLKT